MKNQSRGWGGKRAQQITCPGDLCALAGLRDPSREVPWDGAMCIPLGRGLAMGMVVVTSPAWGKAKCPGCRELGEASLAPNPHLMCSWG